MPWKETCPMDQRIRFIAAFQSERYTMSALARQFGISRKTAYKWAHRYAREGVVGLEERSRRPHHSPRAVDEATEAALLKTKRRFPDWGPRTIRAYLRNRRPERHWPAASTIDRIFRRHGLVKPRRRRRPRTPPHTQPLCHATAPNDLWCADFKGQFRLGNRQWCYPLTVTDAESRYLLVCRELPRPTSAGVWPWFERAFRIYGLPAAIRTDNGAPFASIGLGGLTRLSVWWIKLGITPERIAPGHPEQNPRHERMHRTLKAATAKPPRANARCQQAAFNRFRYEYNELRPHQGLDDQPPASCYRHSSRPWPRSLPEMSYDPDWLVRYVHTTGEIKWRGRMLFASEALCGERIGLKPIEDDVYELHFGHLALALLDDRLGRIIRPG